MNNLSLLSILCPDKPGLISAITGLLFDAQINLADASFTVLGESAELSAICEIPKTVSTDELSQQLRSLDALQDAEIKITPFRYDVRRKKTDTITHQITLQGQDQPGLVARLTEVFGDHDANIVRMDAKTLPGNDSTEYLIQLWVWIPESRLEACLATISNTASWLNMRCHYNAIPPIAEKTGAD